MPKKKQVVNIFIPSDKSTLTLATGYARDKKKKRTKARYDGAYL